MSTRRLRQKIADADIRLLGTFLTVVECGGFAASEVRLNKSKSAISLDISNLETRLGVRLCERGRSGFSLTPEGEAIHEATLDLMQDIERFSERVGTATGQVSGMVRLMVIDNIGSIAETPMVESIRAFRQKHPLAELRLLSGAAGLVEQSVIDGSAHIGISLLPRHVPELATIPLFTEELLLYCGQRHPFFPEDDERIDVGALSQTPLISLSVTDDPAFLPTLDRFAAGVRTSNLDCIILAILAGTDVGFLPPHYARKWVEKGSIRPIKPEVFRTRNQFHLLEARQSRKLPAIRALSNILLHHFRQWVSDPSAEGLPFA